MDRSVIARVRVAASKDVVRVALPTSLVVGILLNVINHGRTLLEDPEKMAWGAVLLNFVVPYCVSTWSASAIRARGEAPASKYPPI